MRKSASIVALTITPILLAYAGSQASAPQSSAPTQSATPAPAHAGQPQANAPCCTAIPATFTNLKVLPPDIKKPDLMKVMKGFSTQLGVRCHFCHEVNDNLTEGNFASDTKDEKQSARLMMKMVTQINADYISKVPDMPAPATCWTCHRGKSTPEQFVPPAPPSGPPPSGAPQGTPPAGTPPPSGPPK